MKRVNPKKIKTKKSKLSNTVQIIRPSEQSEDELVAQLHTAKITVFDLPNLDQMHILNQYLRAIVRSRTIPYFILSKYDSDPLDLIQIPDAKAIYLEACRRGLLGLYLISESMGILFNESIESIMSDIIGIAIGKHIKTEGKTYIAEINPHQRSQLIDTSRIEFTTLCHDLLEISSITDILGDVGTNTYIKNESEIQETPEIRCSVEYRQARIAKIKDSITQHQGGKPCTIMIGRVDSDIKDIAKQYDIPILGADINPNINTVNCIVFWCEALYPDSIICCNPICACIQTNVRYMTCAQCGMTVYCSKLCQRIHWKQHKFECTAHSKIV